MAGQQGQPKHGFGWPDGRLGGLGPAGSTTPVCSFPPNHMWRNFYLSQRKLCLNNQCTVTQFERSWCVYQGWQKAGFYS